MKTVFTFVAAIVVLSACTPEMQQRLEDDKKPRIVSLNDHSVTVSQYGNSMTNRKPLPDTISLAEKTCASMNKKAVYASFTDPDKDSYLDPEFMRNHQLFICS